MSEKNLPFEFPKDQHQDCRTLTELAIEHLPHDGSLGRVLPHRKSSSIWQADDRQDSIYFLQKGNVAILFSDAEGRETILQIVEKGKVFGELCFCGKYAERGSTARATEESQTVSVTLNDFMHYMQMNREVLSALVWTYCIRLADAQSRVNILTYRGAEERLAHLLLHLAISKGQEYGVPPEKKDQVSLNLSHSDIAKLSAMSRPHVTVTMNKLRESGFVEYVRNSTLTVNTSKLEKALFGK